MVKTHNILCARDKHKNISIINPSVPSWLHPKKKNSKLTSHLHYKQDTDDSHLAACSESFVPHMRYLLFSFSICVMC